MGKDKKSIRILYLYDRLIRGEKIVGVEVASKFQVVPKTIDRDTNTINEVLGEYIDESRATEVKKVPRKRVYYMETKEEEQLTKEMALSIIKILLESRAFNKKEVDKLIKNIINKVPKEQRSAIEDLIRNEHFNYAPVNHEKDLLSKMWDISEAVRESRVIEIEYIKQTGATVERKIKPLSIVFSEYYFYLLAYSYDRDYDSPIPYRIDRILGFEYLDERFKIDEKVRFEDGKFRKRVQFMYSGDLMRIKFKFSGQAEVVLDRLPTAKIIGDGIFEAEVYGKGIVMWILSQGNRVEVLEPESLRNEVRERIEDMMSIYK